MPQELDLIKELIDARDEEQKIIDEMVKKRDDETKRLADLMSAKQARVKNAQIQFDKLEKQFSKDPSDKALEEKYENARDVLEKANDELKDLEINLQLQIKEKVEWKRRLTALQ